MYDTYITIVGNVVETPTLRQTKTGTPVTSFRVASTSRRLDRETDQWSDGQRLFATVNCWKAMAQNVTASLTKGQPVVVTGRFYSREYVKGEVSRMSYELDAIAVGHDLARGTAEFTRVVRPYAVTTVDVDVDGLPPNLAIGRDDAGDEQQLAAVG